MKKLDRISLIKIHIWCHLEYQLNYKFKIVKNGIMRDFQDLLKELDSLGQGLNYVFIILRSCFQFSLELRNLLTK